MANTGISIDDQVLDDFDRAIAKQQAEGELPTNINRSKVIEELMEDYAEEVLDQGNPTRMAQTAD